MNTNTFNGERLDSGLSKSKRVANVAELLTPEEKGFLIQTNEPGHVYVKPMSAPANLSVVDAMGLITTAPTIADGQELDTAAAEARFLTQDLKIIPVSTDDSSLLTTALEDGTPMWTEQAMFLVCFLDKSTAMMHALGVELIASNEYLAELGKSDLGQLEPLMSAPDGTGTQQSIWRALGKWYSDHCDSANLKKNVQDLLSKRNSIRDAVKMFVRTQAYMDETEKIDTIRDVNSWTTDQCLAYLESKIVKASCEFGKSPDDEEESVIDLSGKKRTFCFSSFLAKDTKLVPTKSDIHSRV